MTLCLESVEVKQGDILQDFLTPTPKKKTGIMFFYGVDLRKDHLFHVSSAIEEVLGYPSKEVTQKGLKWFIEQIHPEDLRHLNHLADQQSHLAIIPHIHYRFKTKKGDLRLVCEHRYLLRDSNNIPSFLLGQIEKV